MSGFGYRLDRAGAMRRVRAGIQRGMGLALEALARASTDQAPKETGGLTDSCGVREEGLGGAVDYSVSYAAVQHENTALRHKNGGKGKYLSDPAADPAVHGMMLEALAAGCREEMR
ncbi:MAG: hypothetical protein IJ157_14195 [Clostridia bacterium]|nr:hypothetical protein [Clostridia bacterium]